MEKFEEAKRTREVGEELGRLDLRLQRYDRNMQDVHSSHLYCQC